MYARVGMKAASQCSALAETLGASGRGRFPDLWALFCLSGRQCSIVTLRVELGAALTDMHAAYIHAAHTPFSGPKSQQYGIV